MTAREDFELTTTVEDDAPFDTVSELADYLEETSGPEVFEAMEEARRRYLAAAGR